MHDIPSERGEYMKYKMIVSDYDDTLIGASYSVSDRTRDAVNKYVTAGGRFVLATGRMYPSIRPVAKELNLKGEIISNQGGMICDIETDKVLFQSGIETGAVIQFLRFLEGRGIICHAYDADNYYVAGPNPFTDIYASYCGVQPVYAYTKLSEHIKTNGIKIIKMIAVLDPDKIPSLISEAKSIFGNRLLINSSKNWIMEAVSINVSKGAAVKLIAEKYGIRREEIICIGDATNDLTMIEYAGLGVAVDNAVKEIKDAAGYIAPGCDEDGVAHVIEHIALQ